MRRVAATLSCMLIPFVLTACESGPSTGADGICTWFDIDSPNADDPDCIEMNDDDCTPADPGDPDCIRDGIANCTDDEDPDNGPEDCTDDGKTYWKPFQVDVDGTFAYDPASGTAVSYTFDGAERAPELTMVIYNTRFATTGDADDACGLSLIPTTPAAVDWHSFSATLTGSPASYRHFGMTMERGEFDVVDNTLDDQIRGCLDLEATDPVGINPAVWTDSLAALIGSQDWGIYVGPPSAEIRQWLNDPNTDDPQQPYDIYSLNERGFITGASQQASEYGGTQVFWYGYAFALDPSLSLVSSGDDDDPYERVPAAQMTPSDDDATDAARGLYFVRSALFVWQAESLLIGAE